jgi:hypothetical protein
MDVQLPQSQFFTGSEFFEVKEIEVFEIADRQERHNKQIIVLENLRENCTTAQRAVKRFSWGNTIQILCTKDFQNQIEKVTHR